MLPNPFFRHNWRTPRIWRGPEAIGRHRTAGGGVACRRPLQGAHSLRRSHRSPPDALKVHFVSNIAAPGALGARLKDIASRVDGERHWLFPGPQTQYYDALGPMGNTAERPQAKRGSPSPDVLSEPPLPASHTSGLQRVTFTAPRVVQYRVGRSRR